MSERRYLTLSAAAIPRATPHARIRAAARSCVLGAAAILKRAPARFLRPLYGHYLFDDQRDRFERVVRALRNEGDFVDTRSCAAMLAGDLPIDGRYFHLSFDDGYRSVFTNALPVLEQHRVPAIVFVTSALVDADWEASRRLVAGIWDPRGMRPFEGVVELIRWDDLRASIAAGFEVGSHTRNHRCVAELRGDAATLAEELVGSKRDLETALGVECSYLSWPYGTGSDVDDTARAAARAAGYRAAFSAVRGSVVRGRTDPFFIPRHHLDVQEPLFQTLYFARGGWERRR